MVYLLPASPHPTRAHTHTCRRAPLAALPRGCRELAAIGISREPQEEDYQYLSTRAGFVTSASGVRATSASLQELAAFKEWFGG